MVKKVLTEEGIPFEVRDRLPNLNIKRKLRSSVYGSPCLCGRKWSGKGFNNEQKGLMEFAKSNDRNRDSKRYLSIYH
jgi:hypothetical protein